MDILPSIDIRGGKVVRLAQGDYGAETVYGDDPAAVAEKFLEVGARWIHVVDLDGARSGRRTHSDAIGRICRLAASAGAKVECGGGIRDEQSIDALAQMGVSRLVIGSAALKNWPWFERLVENESIENETLALGLDARDGMVAAEGWTEQLSLKATDIAERVSGSGLGAIVYTDIARDGMLSGVNLDSTKDVISATDVAIIASGGVKAIQDIVQCLAIGCGGVIIGRAYYEGKINLSEALEAARGTMS